MTIDVPAALVHGCVTRDDVAQRVEQALAHHIGRYNPLVPSRNLLFPDSVTWRKRGEDYELRYLEKSPWFIPNTSTPVFVTLELASSEGRWVLRADVRERVLAGRRLVERIMNDGTRWTARAFFGLFVVYGIAQLFTGSGQAARTASILAVGTVIFLAFEKFALPLLRVGSAANPDTAIESLRAVLEDALSLPADHHSG